ncbi:MAG TPA: hypothetical protein VJ946_11345, partial [Bacteroidales bacterium]|nr:hypothetical protein [Bacteroidales bacterium]
VGMRLQAVPCNGSGGWQENELPATPGITPWFRHCGRCFSAATTHAIAGHRLSLPVPVCRQAGGRQASPAL